MNDETQHFVLWEQMVWDGQDSSWEFVRFDRPLSIAEARDVFEHYKGKRGCRRVQIRRGRDQVVDEWRPTKEIPREELLRWAVSREKDIQDELERLKNKTDMAPADMAAVQPLLNEFREVHLYRLDLEHGLATLSEFRAYRMEKING